MNRTLRRPMFRMGGSTNEGITSGLDAPRKPFKQGTLPYNMADLVKQSQEQAMDPAVRAAYQPYFERPKGEGLSRFLINFGLNLASTPPMGKGFSGLISTAAGAAKEPTAQLFEDIDREKLQKNVADADLFKTIMEQKGNILSEAAGSDQSSDVFKDQAMMAELAKIVPQISETVAKLKEDPNNKELQDKLQILEGQKKIILGKDPVAEASLEIFVKSPEGATVFSTEREKLLAANPEKYMTDQGVNEILLTQDTMKVIQQILRGFYAEGGRVGLAESFPGTAGDAMKAQPIGPGPEPKPGPEARARTKSRTLLDHDQNQDNNQKQDQHQNQNSSGPEPGQQEPCSGR